MLAFGSFGVPIKSLQHTHANLHIDPLVFQSYKTGMCFVTSWLILTRLPFRFTYFGIFSGLFWVPGGIATVYAIQKAGLALAIGISSSCIVISSFSLGIFYFHESVRSRMEAVMAVLVLMSGLVGMSVFGSMESGSSSSLKGANASGKAACPGAMPVSPSMTGSTTLLKLPETVLELVSVRPLPNAADYSSSKENWTPKTPDQRRSQRSLSSGRLSPSGRSTPSRRRPSSPGSPSTTNSHRRALTPSPTADRQQGRIHRSPSEDVLLRNRKLLAVPDDNTNEVELDALLGEMPHNNPQWTEKQTGMVMAGVFGLWGGCIMVPMKLCDPQFQGANFLISFGIGASIVNGAAWIVRYAYYRYMHGDHQTAVSMLPKFHFGKLWKHGCLSGLLWSIGNFFSLLSVYYLGQGVGYPLVQSQMLISGLWGICYFDEVPKSARPSWFASAAVTLLGILWLSRQHIDE